MKTIKLFATVCQWHQNCNLDLPSRNSNPFGIRGMIYKEFTSFSEAKKTQKQWVIEETQTSGIPDLRSNNIDCGDCTISIIGKREIYAFYQE